MEEILEIKNKTYFFDEELKKELSLVDSFVQKTQKTGSGSGEHKFYFGQGPSGDLHVEFFGGKNFEAKSFVSKENLLEHLDYLKPEYLNPQFDYGKAYNDSQNKKRKNQVPWGGRKILRNEYEPRLRRVSELDEFSEFIFRYQENIKGLRRYGSGVIPKHLYDSYSEYYSSGKDRYELAYAPIFLLSINEFSSLNVLRYKSDDGELIYLFKLLPKKSPKQMAQHPFFSSTNAKPSQTEKRKKYFGRRRYKKEFNPMSKKWRSGSARKLSDIIENAEIYKVQFKVNSNTFEYVGQDSHCSGTSSYYGSSLVMFHYQEIYGSKIFNKVILKSLHNISQEELNRVERTYIKESEERCKLNEWHNLNYTGKNQ